MQNLLEIGQIVNSYGIKGFLKVVPYTDDITRYSNLKEIYIEKNKKLEKMEIEEVKYHKNLVLLKLKGIDDINETCSCGGKTCLEFKIRKNVFSLNYDKFKTQTASELLEYFNGLNDKEYRLHLLAFYINQAIKALTNILNIDLVILTGKLTVFMDDLSKYLYEEKSKNPIGYTNSDCTMITSTYGALAPSIGAAISSSLPENSDLIRWK